MKVRFWMTMLPEAIGLGRELLKSFGGDQKRAVEELKRIRKHRTRYDEAKARDDAEMERLANERDKP